MAQKKPVAKSTVKPAKAKSGKVFTDEERAAMREHAAEVKAAAKRGEQQDAESEVLAKIAAMDDSDRAMAERIHKIVKAAAPDTVSRLWYGMPAYAKNGNVVCFFQDARKFKARYATLGFSDKAALDDGTMWPTSYALMSVTPADEAKITEIVKKAFR